MKKATFYSLIMICTFSLNAQIIYFPLSDTLFVNSGTPILTHTFLPNDHSNSSYAPLELKAELLSNGLMRVTLHANNYNSRAIGRGIAYNTFGNTFGGGALGTCYDIQDSSEWVSYNINNPFNTFTLYYNSLNWSHTPAPPTVDFDLYGLGDRRYLGLKLASNDSIIHYGWADISIDSTGAIVHGWAYENTPNMPITAGSISYSDTCILTSGVLMKWEDGGVPTITTLGGTLQMIAEIIPSNATDTSVTWSVENVTGSATISEEGLLTALEDGLVSVTVKTNDASNISKSMNIQLSGNSTQIHELKSKSYSIYPNPSEGVLNVRSDIIPDRIVIYDIIGSKIKEIKPEKSISIINLREEKRGVYFLKIYSTYGIEMKRIVLN